MNRIVCLAALLTCSIAWAAQDVPTAKQLNPALELTLQKNFLNIPINNRAPKRRMSLTVDSELLGQFDIPLAEDKPDWWAFIDVARFRGQEMAINSDPPPQDWNPISQDDLIKGTENLYQEKYRPQFHFTTRRGWINDPNGLIYYDGEYHMYYQHNPSSFHR